MGTKTVVLAWQVQKVPAKRRSRHANARPQFLFCLPCLMAMQQPLTLSRGSRYAFALALRQAVQRIVSLVKAMRGPLSQGVAKARLALRTSVCGIRSVASGG